MEQETEAAGPGGVPAHAQRVCVRFQIGNPRLSRFFKNVLDVLVCGFFHGKSEISLSGF